MKEEEEEEEPFVKEEFIELLKNRLENEAARHQDIEGRQQQWSRSQRRKKSEDRITTKTILY